MPNPRLVKLVCDRVGSIFGDSTVTYAQILDREEAVDALRYKLLEEAIEYLRDPCVEELADVLEVARALSSRDLKCGWGTIEEVADRKVVERGGFGAMIGMYVRSSKVSS